MLLEIIGAILSMVGSWMIFKKMGRQGWEGIVPIYSTYVLCKVLYGNGWKFLLLLIPFYNIYFAIKMMVDLAKAFNQGVGFAIGLLLLPFVFNLILAFGGVLLIYAAAFQMMDAGQVLALGLLRAVAATTASGASGSQAGRSPSPSATPSLRRLLWHRSTSSSGSAPSSARRPCTSPASASTRCGRPSSCSTNAPTPG